MPSYLWENLSHRIMLEITYFVMIAQKKVYLRRIK